MSKKMVINILKEILRPIRAFIYRIYYGLLVKTTKKPFILCECYLSMRFRTLKKRNWGDDLNYYFFERLTGKKVINIPFSKMYNKGYTNVYSLIGSILNFYNLNKKIVYGSGIMDPDVKVRGLPQKILAVRGPKTRDVLIEQGIDCPANYGDPVLLLPCIYKGIRVKHNKPVIIPNMGTFDCKNSIIEKLAKELDAVILDLRKYKQWTDPIDMITGASFVISESLHGLIVAETYGIPNVWVEFISHPSYWEFKYRDFYESIEKNEDIIRLHTVSDMEKVYVKLKGWEKGKIDYDKLKSFFPFQISWENELDY